MSPADPDETVPAFFVRLLTRQAFPPDDERKVAILRLMAATNDTRQIEKLLLMTWDSVAPHSTRADKAIHNGELLYWTRLFVGHLYEAGIAFRALDTAHSSFVTAAMVADARGLAALDQVRTVFHDTSEGSFVSALGAVRNLVAFHYKDGTFRESLEQLPSDDVSHLLLTPFVGFGRYLVTDVLLQEKLLRATGGTETAMRAAIERAIGLGGALETIVAHLATGIAEDEKVYRGTVADTITVPPELRADARARRAQIVQPGRGAPGPPEAALPGPAESDQRP